MTNKSRVLSWVTAGILTEILGVFCFNTVLNPVSIYLNFSDVEVVL